MKLEGDERQKILSYFESKPSEEDTSRQLEEMKSKSDTFSWSDIVGK